MPPGGGPLGFCIVGGSITVLDCRMESIRWKERIEKGRRRPLAIETKRVVASARVSPGTNTVISQTADASRTTSCPDGCLCLGAFFRTASCSLQLAGAGPSGT